MPHALDRPLQEMLVHWSELWSRLQDLFYYLVEKCMIDKIISALFLRDLKLFIVSKGKQAI